MKTAAIILLLLVSSLAWAQKATPASGETGPNLAVEAKYPNFIKHWYVGLGPVVSNNLLGSNGTKYAVTLGYTQGLSEHWNLHYFSDNNFNTASQGSSLIQSINVGTQYFFRDRGADNSLFAMVDLGYGGGNKINDASGIGGVAAGMQFYRTGDFTFEAKVRLAALYSSSGGLAGLSTWTQFMLGIYF